MYHLRRIKVLLATCLLACTSLWAQDVKISLAKATAEATSDQGGDEGASSAIDGDYSKFWHSQWSWGAVFEKVNSVDLTIALSEVTLVDYVRYIPRQGSNQGHWGEVEVFYSPNTTGTSFTSVGTFNLNMADIPHDFFLNGTEGVSCGQIKFTIRSGSNNHATAAEIEMYQLDKDKLNAFAQCFSDAVYTELKPGVTSSSIADADVRALVQSMQSNSTSYKKFRVGEYEAYETLGTLQQRLKTKNQYSRYENPTGVYFTAGQSYLVAVSGIEDDAVGLKVKNWYLSESSSTYSLRNGLNYITATTEGNVFVNYYTDNYAEAPKVKVHFINAPVIGYWNKETMTNSDWEEMLKDKAADDNRIIITQSEHAQTAFPISAWKTHCPDDVEALMGHYQNVQWALRDMMGLEKYGYQTRNRQIFYVVDGGFMAAGGEGAYCDYADLGGIMNANSFDFWGVAHEWGHNNQIDPGFHWSGCGETTNNIYASWAQYHFTANRDAAGNPYNLRLEDEKSGIDEYSDMRGGRMQTYFEEAVRKGVAWQLQDGPDYHNETPKTITVTGRDADGNDIGEVTTTSRNYDHFVKLTPFWQLNLWGNLAGKCPDIITDVIHSIRTAENYAETYNTNGKQQINWMKLACDHAGIDLLPFFEKAGMLRPIHAYIEDYGAGWNIITEGMIDELKAYVAQKGYPAYTEEINYINAHNMHIYRDNLKLNVTGMQGELNGDKLIVQHSVAKNAVAFETYNAQDELIRITMYGLGSNDEHSFTQVLFPSDAAYVKAVGYDGERQMVYKVRTEDELQTLISEAESLLSDVGSVNNPVAQKVELTADNYYCNATYTASNNGDKFTTYEVLCDGDPSTYLHTDYSGNAPSESHYVTIDLGSGNELTFFNLNYRTRKEDNVCAPTKVTIEASNDDKTWVTLREVTSGLNTGNNQVNTIEELGDGTPYRYIRMKVLETSTSTRYFVLSEMGLSELSYDVNLQPSYSLISTGVVVAAHLALQSAQEVVKNGTDYTTAYIALQKSVDALLAHPLVDVTKFYTLACWATDHSAYIRDNGTVVNGRSAEGSLFQFVAADDDNGYYIKSYVTDRYLNYDGANVYVDAEASTIWTMASHSTGAMTLTIGNDLYLNNNGAANTGAANIVCPYLQLKEHNGGPAPDNACSLWTITEGTPLDKSALLAKINEFEPVVDACVTDPLFVTEQLISEIRNIIADARVKYGSRATTQSEYESALTALYDAESTLATAKANAEAEAKARAEQLVVLREWIVTVNDLMARCKENSGDATQALIKEVYDALHSANELAESPSSTSSQLADAAADLQAKYAVLDAAQQSTAKAELRELIAQTQALIAECGTYGFGEHMVKTPVALQVDHVDEAYYLFTNADHNVVGGGAKDGDGIAALIDGTVNTYMHTQWGGNPITDDHYVQVDLGNDMGLAEFAFTYATRKVSSADYNSPAPTIIEVYGSSDGFTFDAQIARFTSSDETNPLISYKELGEYWESANIKPNRAYDYLRFYVRESKGPQSNTQHGDHYYFAMSEFALSAVSYETSYYVESLTSYGNVTEEQFLNVARAYDAANDLVDNSYDKDELVNAKNNLQAYYDVLMAAHNDYSYLPVTLTTDVENPALYTFNSKRGTTEKPKVLQYAPAEGHMFTIVDATAEVSAKQLFYFTKGTEKGQVYVHPFAAGEQVLAADNTGNGAAKVFARKKGAENYEQWTFEQETVDNAVWYSLKVVGAAAYFSNYGGEGRKMGFFGSKDNGSCMTFTPASIEGSAAYHTLKVYLDEAVKDVSSNNPGYYRGTDAHASVYETAVEVLGDQSSDDADYLNAYNTLLSVNESLEMILPEVGKFYVIRSAHDGYAKDALVYANLDDNKMRWGSKELTDATAIWTIVPAGDGAYHICNLHTGTYINGVNETLNETAGKVTLESLSVNGQLGFHSDEMMHAQSGGAIVNYTTSANGASAWRIEEVGHTAKIGQYLHTSLYLDYPTIIPEGVKAYIAKNPSEEGTIDLVKLQGNVLPANTGVILYSETPGTYYFLYTDAEATDDVSENLLKGCASEQYVGDETGAKKYYIFGRKDDNVGLYWARMDYTTDGSYVGNDRGTHFKASANKVYLELDVVSDFALSGLRFRIGDDETGIEGISTNGDSIIYDLYGRRIMEVVTPGIYIINGEKRYINIK